MQRYLFFFLYLAGALSASAQEFGGNPPSMRWNQVNTDTVRVIFPRGLEPQGLRVANTVHYLNRYTRRSIGEQQRKLNIVLQNQTMVANGYVGLAPFRSEFQLTPSPNSFELGSLPWLDMLAIHEYRHALQNMHFRQGLSKAFYILFGELGQEGITNLAVPNWFWEGDAVVTETALSHQGRGRLPAFFNEFRGITLDDKHYSFFKIRNGSYKDIVPDHYPLGYLMTSYGRDHYGVDFWKEVTSDAVRFRGVFYPFSHSLKQRTGYNVKDFYKAALYYYQRQWEAQKAQAIVTAARQVTPSTRTVTDYLYAYSTKDGRLVALKRSFKQVPAFYLIDEKGRERRLTGAGLVFDNYFSYKHNKILWTQARFDPRWGWKDFSVVKVYDIKTGQQQTLTHRSKYFSPDLSNDGQLIVVSEATPRQEYHLQLLDAESGTVVKTLPNPGHYYYTYPKFTADDKAVISAVRNEKGEMALVRQELATGVVQELIPFSFRVIGIPTLFRDFILFPASFGKVDNLYAVKQGDTVVYQVTNRLQGVYHSTVNEKDNSLLFSQYSLKGRQLYQMTWNPDVWKPVPLPEALSTDDLPIAAQEGGNILGKIPVVSRPVKKYAQLSHLLNFHSWVPSFDDPNYGIRLLSNNILNTLDANLSYTYNRNEASSQIGAGAVFGGLLPVISTNGSYTFHRNDYVNATEQIFWNEWNYRLGIGFPLNLSSGMYNRFLSFGADINALRRYTLPNQKYRFRDSVVNYISLGLSFVNQRIKARQNIFSHFAQSLSLGYYQSVNAVPAEQWYGRFDLYLPGLFANHSLVLQAAFQQHDTLRRYAFSDHFVYARGYGRPFYQYIYKLGVNYHFPIAYPDWGFGGILYFLRLRGNLFYDFSSAYHFRFGRQLLYRAAGGELYFDTKLLNQVPFSFGVRYSRLFDKDPIDTGKRQQFDLIIPLQQLLRY